MTNTPRPFAQEAPRPVILWRWKTWPPFNPLVDCAERLPQAEVMPAGSDSDLFPTRQPRRKRQCLIIITTSQMSRFPLGQR